MKLSKGLLSLISLTTGLSTVNAKTPNFFDDDASNRSEMTADEIKMAAEAIEKGTGCDMKKYDVDSKYFWLNEENPCRMWMVQTYNYPDRNPHRCGNPANFARSAGVACPYDKFLFFFDRYGTCEDGRCVKKNNLITPTISYLANEFLKKLDELILTLKSGNSPVIIDILPVAQDLTKLGINVSEVIGNKAATIEDETLKGKLGELANSINDRLKGLKS